MNHIEYLDWLKKYEEQKKLEDYQIKRILPKPKTKKIHLVFYAGVFLAVIIGHWFAFMFLIPIWAKILFILNACIFSELYLRFLGVKAIECYQHYASEERRRKCLCIPSCSEYAIACFKKYLFIKAVFKIRRRLFKTCRGDEYKIDRP